MTKTFIPNFTHADPTQTLSSVEYRAMIEQQLMDDLDSLSIRFLTSLKKQPLHALDLGGRQGVHSKRLSIAGATVTMIDLIDLPENHFTQYGHDGLLFPSITHLRKNFKDIEEGDIPNPLTLIYSQRALNYLDYSTTKKLLTMLFEKLSDGGAIFISLAGYDTEYGLTHYAREKSIEHRHDYVGSDMQIKHNMLQKITIYKQSELEDLLKDCGFTAISSMQSGFGNVKALGYKNPELSEAPLEF